MMLMPIAEMRPWPPSALAQAAAGLVSTATAIRKSATNRGLNLANRVGVIPANILPGRLGLLNIPLPLKVYRMDRKN